MATLFKDKIPLNTPYINPLSKNFLNPGAAGMSTNNVQPAQSIGVKAAAPAVKPVTNTIQPNQAVKPNSSSTLPSLAKKATLYGANGSKEVVDVGSTRASQLQSQGYGLTPGSYKAPTTPTTNTVTPTAPITDITSKGILTSLVDTSNKGNEYIPKAQEGLMKTAETNPGTSGPAWDNYQKSVSDLATLKQGMSKEFGNIENSGLPLEFKQGREAVLNRQYAAQIAAAEAKVTQAQQGLGYQISGTKTQQAGYNQAGGLGNAAQGLTQSGLTSAAATAQPQQVQYGTPLVNPQTGEVLNGGGTTSQGVSPSSPFYATMQSYAQLLASNQGSAVPGSITSNPVLNAQLIEMARKINPSFNVNVASAAGAAQGQAAGQQYGLVESYTSAHQQVNNLATQLGDAIKTWGLNPSEINKGNAVIQGIASNISDSRYQILSNYLTDIASLYSQILTPAGGSSTDTTRATATSMINGVAQGQSIMSVIDGLDAQAKAKIAGIPTAGGLGANTNTNTNNSNSTSADGIDWNFHR